MAVELRLLRREDAARCAELEQLLFSEENPWSEADFVAEMAQPHTFYVGVDVDGEVVAYGGLAMLGPADDPEFEIHTVGVDPRWQRRGFGRLVMDNFVHVANTAGGPIFWRFVRRMCLRLRCMSRWGLSTRVCGRIIISRRVRMLL